METLQAIWDHPLLNLFTVVYIAIPVFGYYIYKKFYKEKI